MGGNAFECFDEQGDSWHKYAKTLDALEAYVKKATMSETTVVMPNKPARLNPSRAAGTICHGELNKYVKRESTLTNKPCHRTYGPL